MTFITCLSSFSFLNLERRHGYRKNSSLLHVGFIVVAFILYLLLTKKILTQRPLTNFFQSFQASKYFQGREWACNDHFIMRTLYSLKLMLRSWNMVTPLQWSPTWQEAQDAQSGCKRAKTLARLSKPLNFGVSGRWDWEQGAALVVWHEIRSRKCSLSNRLTGLKAYQTAKVDYQEYLRACVWLANAAEVVSGSTFLPEDLFCQMHQRAGLNTKHNTKNKSLVMIPAHEKCSAQ